MPRKKTITQLLLLALFGAALFVSVHPPSNDSAAAVAAAIQQELHKKEALFFESASDTALLGALAGGRIEAKSVATLTHSGFQLFYYQKDTLAAWTSNQVNPPALTDVLGGKAVLRKMKNGWYVIFSAADKQDKTMLMALLPLKLDYPFENKFLKNSFALPFSVPDNVALSDKPIPSAVSVTDKAGNFLLAIYQVPADGGKAINTWALGAQLLFLLLLFYYIALGAGRIEQRSGFAPAFFFLVSALLLIRVVMLLGNVPPEINKLDLFNPRNYASSVVTKSLGDLVLNILLCAWVVCYYVYRVPEPKVKKMLSLSVSSGIATVYLFSSVAAWVYQTMVMDSVISFEMHNVLGWSAYSLLGILAFALLLLAHFMLLQKLVQRFIHQEVKTTSYLATSTVLVLCFALVATQTDFAQVLLFTLVWTWCLLVFMWWNFRRKPKLAVEDLLIYVVFYAIAGTFFTTTLYAQKEQSQRILFASKLGTERDYVAEYLFTDIAQRISRDAFVRSFFKNPLLSKKQIADRINALYLNGYFNKYEMQLFAFDHRRQAVQTEDTAATKSALKLLADAAPPFNRLVYLTDSVRSYTYYSVVRLSGDSTNLGYLLLKLSPKVYYGNNVYPELLVGGNVLLPDNSANYQYAIYRNDRLVAQFGDYPYPYQWHTAARKSQHKDSFVREKAWSHYVAHFADGKEVVVSLEQNRFLEPVATFSYYFTLFFFIALAVSWSVYLLKKRNKQSAAPFLSFRLRINYAMAAVILFSCLVIGIITVSFFGAQYKRFYNDRLMRKEKAILASIEYFIGQNSLWKGQRWSDNMDVEIAHLAELNSVDINLFDNRGNLLQSSQPAIYENGIIGKKMNPKAYFRLVRSGDARVTIQENIGALHYLAAYSPVRDLQGAEVGFLSIPYFERSKEIDSDTSGFLAALMNVYVFLFIIAVLLAYLVSNSITKPLAIIGEKLRLLNLNKKNEPIEWHSRDEIGALVSEYNKMIVALEKSARRLAKSERESAWREMAKQVAHEIKNPLTPMKLSVQFLRRAIAEKRNDVPQLTERVAATLEEQIDSLSAIASAFSAFAKMPPAQKERINLNHLLPSVVALFTEEKNVAITFRAADKAAEVFADKNQMISVLNNLIKNAIQSIPDGREGIVEVRLEEQPHKWMVSVQDNGSGISPADLAKVFVPNFTTKSSGTGLGLAISRRIVEESGGEIWLNTEVNKGTTFYVSLPKLS